MADETVRLSIPERIAACLIAGVTAAIVAFVST